MVNDDTKTALELTPGRTPMFQVPYLTDFFTPKIDQAAAAKLVELAEAEEFNTKLLVYCGLFLGLKLGEVTALKTDHYFGDGERKCLYVGADKANPRLIRVAAEVIPLLDKAKFSNQSPYFFYQNSDKLKPAGTKIVWRWFNNFVKKHDLNFVFGDLRNFVIHQQLSLGIDHRKISAYFGITLRRLNEVFLKHKADEGVEFSEECATTPILTNRPLDV